MIEEQNAERVSPLQQPVGRWVPVAEGMPPFFQEVLVKLESERSPIRIAWRGKAYEEDDVGQWREGPKTGVCHVVADKHISHWMQLLEPPV